MELTDSKDEVLLKYLLSEQSKDENEELEDEMVLDPALSERLQVVEMNLIENYVLDQMSPGEKARFEKGFLLFPENQEKLEDARAFHEGLRLRREVKTGDRPLASAEVSSTWFASLFQIPVWVRATAVVILVTTVVVVAYFLIQPPKKRVANNNTGEKVANNNASNNPGPEGKQENTNTKEPTNSQANDAPKEEIAKLNPNTYNIVVPILELRGRADRTTARGAGNTGKVRPHLIGIPRRAEFFTLEVRLMPHKYFEQDSDCSVDISNSTFQRVFPRGEGNDLVKVMPTERKNFPYQVSIRIPTVFLKEGQLYYFRVAETDSLTPFIIKFTN